MNKRLEEMDQLVDDLINDRVELNNFVNDYFLQAERVQELESTNEGIKKTADVIDERYQELHMQNKRYRELIATITTDDSMTYRQIVDLLIGALEGDPHESI